MLSPHDGRSLALTWKFGLVMLLVGALRRQTPQTQDTLIGHVVGADKLDQLLHARSRNPCVCAWARR